jgi:hypothetical protein
MHITPLATASTHVNPDPTRTRKLLLHAGKSCKLIGKVERAGYALVPLDLHFVRGRIKLEVGLAKGKKQHDKRNDEQEKDWKRETEQIMKEKPALKSAMDALLYWVGHVAVAVNALTGVLDAGRKQMDLIGAVMVGVATALGGGTIRDLLLDRNVFWVVDQTYLLVALLAGLMTFFGTQTASATTPVSDP